MEVTGRTKDLIIRKGEKIAPLELETLLIEHPAVAEVAVIGLPDAERGELPRTGLGKVAKLALRDKFSGT